MAVKDHMVSRTNIPRPPLSDFVEVFWQYDGLDPSHARESCLPTDTMEIVVDLPLASLRLGLEFEHEGLVAFGSGESGRLVIYASERPITGFHVAFSAPSREAVDRFHAAGQEGPSAVRLPAAAATACRRRTPKRSRYTPPTKERS